MKIAICYYSKHHGNTLQVVSAMAEGRDVTLIDIRKKMAVNLKRYDYIGLASGVYGLEMAKELVSFVKQYMPRGKEVFFIYTYSFAKGDATKKIREVLYEKDCHVYGEFSCHGFTTVGPFALVKGIYKGHPTLEELAKAREFMDVLEGPPYTKKRE